MILLAVIGTMAVLIYDMSQSVEPLKKNVKMFQEKLAESGEWEIQETADHNLRFIRMI